MIEMIVGIFGILLSILITIYLKYDVYIYREEDESWSIDFYDRK